MPESLIARFANTASDRLQKIALITERSQLSYEDVLRLVSVFDVQLRRNGVADGQTIVIGSSRSEFVLAMSLVLSLRSYKVVFSDANSVLNAEIEFDWYIDDEASYLLPSGKQIIISADWFQNLNSISVPDYTKIEYSSGAFVVRTSGSTGRPKFVESKESERINASVRAAGIPGLDYPRIRQFATVGTRTGWGISLLLGPLLKGGSVLSLGENFRSQISYLDLYRINLVVTTPAGLSQLANVDGAEVLLGSIADIRVGGAFPPEKILSEFMKISPAKIHIGYGASEIGNVFHCAYDRNTPFVEGYLGQLSNNELEVGFYDETFQPLPKGTTEGVVGIRRKSKMDVRRYVGQQAEEQSFGMIGDVFFPGDIMRKDESGYYYVGRIKNIINISGNKYSLEAIEGSLSAQFEGYEFVTLVEKGDRDLEVLNVFYKGGSDIDREDIQAFLGRQFTGAKVLKASRVDLFPLTETGKIDRQALKSR